MGNLYSLSLPLWKQAEFYLGKPVMVCLILNIPSVWKLSQIMKPQTVGEMYQQSPRVLISPWANKIENKMSFVVHRVPGMCAVSVPLPSLSCSADPKVFNPCHFSTSTWLQNLKKTKNTVTCDRHLWTSAYWIKMDGKSLLDLTLTYLETKAMR